MKDRRRLEVRISPDGEGRWRVEAGCHVMTLTSAEVLRTFAKFIADPYGTWESYRRKVIAARERSERESLG